MSRREQLERIGQERLAASRAADRDARVAFVKAILGCIGSCAFGALLIGLSFHATESKAGWIYFWAGMTLGYAGILLTLHWYYISGVERGDWQ